MTDAISDRKGRCRVCWSNTAQLDRLLVKVQSADPETKESLMPLLEEFHGYYLA